MRDTVGELWDTTISVLAFHPLRDYDMATILTNNYHMMVQFLRCYELTSLVGMTHSQPPRLHLNNKTDNHFVLSADTFIFIQLIATVKFFLLQTQIIQSG